MASVNHNHKLSSTAPELDPEPGKYNKCTYGISLPCDGCGGVGISYHSMDRDERVERFPMDGKTSDEYSS
jgi:hypothetical protein